MKLSYSDGLLAFSLLTSSKIARLWKGKHFFRRFFRTKPTVGNVFVRLQHDGRITRNLGGEDVFAVFKNAFGIAMAPVMIDFINGAVVPVFQLAVCRRIPVSSHTAPCGFFDTLALFQLPVTDCHKKTLRRRAFNQQDIAVFIMQNNQSGNGILKGLPLMTLSLPD